MKAVSRGQALEISARVATQIDWDQLDADKLQQEVVELSVEEFRRRFTAFLQNGCRLVLASLVLAINRLKPFNPSEFVGSGWAIWRGAKNTNGLKGKEKQDTRSLALKEVDWSKVLFETCLKEGETRITGEEKLIRLEVSSRILLDAGIGRDLFLDYQSNKENSVLEKLRRERGITYLDFFGTILRNSDGYRYVLCLDWDVGRWYWRVRWLDRAWSAFGPSAVLAS